MCTTVCSTLNAPTTHTIVPCTCWQCQQVRRCAAHQAHGRRDGTHLRFDAGENAETALEEAGQEAGPGGFRPLRTHTTHRGEQWGLNQRNAHARGRWSRCVVRGRSGVVFCRLFRVHVPLFCAAARRIHRKYPSAHITPRNSTAGGAEWREIPRRRGRSGTEPREPDRAHKGGFRAVCGSAGGAGPGAGVCKDGDNGCGQ